MRKFDYRNMAVDDLDEFGMSPLMWAAWVGDVGHVRTLLAQGADPNAQPQGNPPALYLAMETYCAEEMVRMLLMAGADVNASSMGHTVLLRAVTNTDVNIIRLLIQAGADVNAQMEERATPETADCDGMTPLMMASLRDDGAILIPLLLEAGADIMARDRKGRTALVKAREWGAGESVSLLKEAEDRRCA